MRNVKDECRVIGIDDMAFDKFNDEQVSVLGVIFRGGKFMDGCLSTVVEVDGNDATKKISEMITTSKFKKQIRSIMLDGIAVGGFNVIDINKMHALTNIPVIVIIRRKPDIQKIHNALEKLDMHSKIMLLQNAGNVKELKLEKGKIFFQYAGLEEDKVREIIKKTTTHSFIPEPIRVAHMVGQGIALGESRGQA